MNYNAVRCPNMNHSRSNAPVKYCPTCGEVVNREAKGRCDQNTHARQMKDQMAFCTDCGKKLSGK